MKFKRKYIIGIIIVAVIGGGVGYKYMNSKSKPASSDNAKVENDYTLVTGSGTIRSANTFQVTPSVAGKLTKVYFKEGDNVKENDLMYEIDSFDAQMNITKLSNALEQAIAAQKNDMSQLGDLNVFSPFSGQVSNILVKKGDVIAQGSPVLTVSDRAKMKITVPFNNSQISQIENGQSAEVYINNINQMALGTVTYISPESHASSENAKLYNVEITVKNPGALKEEQVGTVIVNTNNGKITSPESGTLKYFDSVVVKSISAGIVESIDLKEGQFVDQGTILLTLSNKVLSAAIELDNLKIKDLQEQLMYAKKQLEYYKIYAPMTGTILKQNKKAGELAAVGEQLSTIADMDNMELIIDIDDTDIANVKIGQKASVKIDALAETESKPLELTITKIPLEGNTQNGITSYPVTLSIVNMPDIKIGMNANIEIKVEKK